MNKRIVGKYGYDIRYKHLSDMRFLLYSLLTTIEREEESLLDESLLDVVELGNVLRAVDQRLDLRLEVLRSLRRVTSDAEMVNSSPLL